jgi:hypothetical protein
MKQKRMSTFFHWLILAIVTFLGTSSFSYIIRVIVGREPSFNWESSLIFSIVFPSILILNEKFKSHNFK